MMLVPVTYKGGIHQHDVIIDLIEDLGGYIVQKYMVAQEVVLQAVQVGHELGERRTKTLADPLEGAPL